MFRRPRPAANLKYVMTPDEIFNIKTGELTARDPDTGEPVGMNLMADSRHLTLKQQAIGAYGEHQEGRSALAPRDLRAIVDFESQVYVAQAVNRLGRSLVEANGPPGLGPRAMADGRVHVLANNQRDPVFRTFEPWMKPERLPRGSVRAPSASCAPRSRAAATSSCCGSSGCATSRTSTRSASAIRSSARARRATTRR